MCSTFSFRIPAELHRLAEMRRLVEERAIALNVDASAVYDIILAVNEIATNIIVHGYRDQPGMIEIEVGQADDSLILRLRDQAPPFDPTLVPPPDTTLPLEKRPPGGMGLHITRRLMDAMTYRAIPNGGNELTLMKKGIVATLPEEETHAHDRRPDPG